jgi:anti-sigma factor (TIGR02949 family)
MPSCREVGSLITPYIDGELSAAERSVMDGHLSACPPCRRRAESELAARETLRSRVHQPSAPEHLRKRCRKATTPMGRIACTYSSTSLSMFAAVIVVAGGVSVYGLTRMSPTVLAAQLTLDHVKCFALHPSTAPMDVRSTEERFAERYGWRLHVPMASAGDDLQLVGVRRCFCGEGPAVHVMYRHHGEPLSLYVLPHVAESSSASEVFGHDAVMWTNQDTTFVLLGKEPAASLRQLAGGLH